ncbi:hypothetical protein BH18ACT7_BH18ACT7_22380 [soil metagenome]
MVRQLRDTRSERAPPPRLTRLGQTGGMPQQSPQFANVSDVGKRLSGVGYVNHRSKAFDVEPAKVWAPAR